MARTKRTTARGAQRLHAIHKLMATTADDADDVGRAAVRASLEMLNKDELVKLALIIWKARAKVKASLPGLLDSMDSVAYARALAGEQGRE